MTGTLLNQAQQEASEEDEAEDPVDRQINGLHIDGEADGVYRANMPRPPPRHTQAPVTPRTPRAPVTPRTPRASVTPRTPRPRCVTVLLYSSDSQLFEKGTMEGFCLAADCVLQGSDEWCSVNTQGGSDPSQPNDASPRRRR